MLVELFRYHTTDKSTLGLLFINGQFQCYTLEDTYNEIKIQGRTRIPSGTYLLGFRKEGGFHTKYSSKFPDMHKGMIEIKNVPNFTYVLIHIGNDPLDTEGCLLVGTTPGSDYVSQSTEAYKKIYPIIASVLEKQESVILKVYDNIHY